MPRSKIVIFSTTDKESFPPGVSVRVGDRHVLGGVKVVVSAGSRSIKLAVTVATTVGGVKPAMSTCLIKVPLLKWPYGADWTLGEGRASVLYFMDTRKYRVVHSPHCPERHRCAALLAMYQ